MTEQFVYVSKARFEVKEGYRNAYQGEIAEPVVYGVLGALKEYYRAPSDAPPIASTLDHIVSAVAG